MIKRLGNISWKFFDIKNFILNLSTALLYIVSGKLGLSLAFVNASTTAVWPPTGIALSSVVLFGYRVIPAIFLGAFIVNFTTTGNLLTSLGIALGNTLEGVVGAYLVKKFAGGSNAFLNVSNIIKFTFLAAILSTMISADIGVFTLILGKLATWKDFAPIWMTWWLGDMGGNLIIAPLLIVWGENLGAITSYRKLPNLAISFTTLFLVTEIVFSGILPYPYLCIPIGVWIAFWFGQKGTTLATLFVGILSIFYTLHGLGPFGNGMHINQSLILLQLFLGVFSLTTLAFASMVVSLKRSQRILRSNESYFHSLIENSFDAIVLIDTTSKILFASPSVKRLLGYTPDELIGWTGFDLIVPGQRPYVMAKLAELVLKPGGSITVQYQTIRKDEKLIWVEATGTNLLFEPNVNAVVVNFRDITQSKNLQLRILRENMIDEAMLSSIGDGIIATDEVGKITMANHAASEMLGWSENELINTFITDSIPMVDKDGKILTFKDRPISKVLSLGKEIITSPNHYYVRRDKTKFPVQFTVTPIVLEDKLAGTIEVFRDITKEKEIDSAQSEFVSIASHQLRTPLTIISWYIERLMKDKSTISKKQQDYLGEIYHASQRMVNLINALLNVSRLELGTTIINSVPVDLLKIINDMLTELQPQINDKKLHISKKYPKKNPTISADLKLMTIVVQNLLSNAIKYSRAGGKIEIKVNSDKNNFLMQVTDDGYGIPKKQQSKIFTKMFRADNA